MKEYIRPILEIFYCESEDIITSSPNQFDNICKDLDNWEEG